MAAPSYSPYLQFNPTFRYGGREFGAGDEDIFRQLLRKRGRNYNTWARRHANAAKVFDPAEQQLYGMLQPEIDAINYERQKTASGYQRRAHDLAGFTQAIMGMLGEISPAIRGAYGEGAETMSAGGTGFGDVLNQNMAANAAKGNSLLDVLGSEQHIEGGDAGSVLAGLAGWLPSEMLNKQGAAYADAAAQLPKEASFQAQIEMKHQLAEAAEADEGFSQEIMGILKGIPSTRAELGAQQAEMRLAQQEFRLKQISEDRDFWLQQQALLLSQGKLKLAKQAERRAQQAQQRYNYESAGRDYEGNPMPGYTVNPKTGTLVPPGYRVDKNGNVVKQYAADGKKSGGYTATQKQAMLETIDGKAEEIKDMVLAGVQSGVWTPTSGRPQDRAKLGRQIFEHFKHLAGTPAAKKRLRQLIAKTLQTATRIGPPVPGGTSSSGGSDFWDVG
jgi:hypothetical protein